MNTRRWSKFFITVLKYFKIKFCFWHFRNDEGEEDDRRLTWSLELFHDVEVDPDAPKWRKVFQRGIQMRRNICQGKFELWRLYLTDSESLPVKKMTKDTTFRELRYFFIVFIGGIFVYLQRNLT